MGYALALACALIWSIYSVVSRLLSTVPTDAVGWFCFVTALLALICHALLETMVWSLSLMRWIGIVGLGLGPVGIAFFTWDYGIKHGNIQLLGVLSYAAPLISVVLLLIAYCLLLIAGEAQLSAALGVACFAIVGGSMFAGLKGNG